MKVFSLLQKMTHLNWLPIKLRVFQGRFYTTDISKVNRIVGEINKKANETILNKQSSKDNIHSLESCENTLSVEFGTTLLKEIEEKMRKGFVEYESNHGIDVNYKDISLVLKDSRNNLIGVLKAYTVFAEIYIDDLWVDKSFRGKGYGKKLLQELESHFKDKGFNNINLMTNKFQAPEFYKKCGFKAEFVRQNVKNPKLTKFFFIKYFENEVQTQGILEKI